MKTVEFINQCVEKSISFSLEEGGQLKVNAIPGALTDDIICQLKEKKLDIINWLQVQMSERILPVSKFKNPLPLSFAQQRLWLLDCIDGSAHYNMPGILKLSGKVDCQALNQSFVTIIDRHESLRTCFAMDESGHPIQVIQTTTPFKVQQNDLSALTEDERQLQLAELLLEDASTAFDLSKDLMLRVRLIKIATNENILSVTMHHIAFDGWSMSILIDELGILYRAYSQGEANPLAPLAIQYSDYAYWQRNWLQSEVLDKQLDYWKGQLAGLPIVHSLPLDHARPNIQSFVGKVFTSRIDNTVGKALIKLCQSYGATLFMGLHATFSVLLSRYSNNMDIVIGSPIANREQAEVANLIGFFVNTLVLRSDLSGAPDFVTLLEQSKNTLLDAYTHQQVPFDKIVEHLQPERNLSHSPLFQIMLVLQNNTISDLEIPDLTLTLTEQSIDIAKYDLTLSVNETVDGLDLSWEYRTDLFDANTIARMATHFELLLKALVTNPNQNVFDLDMLSEQEHHQLLVEWNTIVDYPQDKCVHELFELNAKNNPDSIAVVFADQRLTYCELNQKANQLAHFLVTEKHVKPDTLVGICVERSIEMLIGILAILKAGGAYVPLDPEYPEARLKYMLDDASLTTVLTLHHLREITPISDAQAVCLDDESVQCLLLQQPTKNINPQQLGLTSNNLAYVIYTSGSTGNPKGVMVEHCNVTRLLDSAEKHFEFKQQDVWTMFHSFAFDFSVWEIWGALAYGGRLVIVPYWISRSPSDFYQLLLTESVTVLNQTPSAFNMLMREDTLVGARLALRYVVFGGEALNLASLLPWFDRYGDDQPQLINMYGITETTVHVTYRRITKEVAASSASVSLIGGPLSDLKLVVLSDRQILVPIGVVGEIYVGGAGVTRGYLNQPQLTQNRFVTLMGFGNERFYRTGDLARFLPNAELEYWGRIDHQVKIRGFRIELGEIENALSLYSEVKDVIVLAKESIFSEKRLVAYVATDAVNLQHDLEISTDQQHKFIENLRLYLKDSLPDYMIPSAFVLLNSLPLTSNGKIDRKALPEPDFSLQQKEYIAPKNETEKVLCEIWQEILGVERVGITDSFFQIGGDSMSALRFVGKAREKGFYFAVRHLFANDSIRKLLEFSGNSLYQVASQDLIVGEAPLSSAQQWFFGAILVNPNVAITSAFQEFVDIDVEMLEKALWEVLKHHDALRAKFHKGNTGWIQVLVKPEDVFIPINHFDISNLTLSEQIKFIDELGVKVQQEGISIADAPLIKVQIFNRGSVGFAVRFWIHHLLFDGFSLNVVLEDFMQCYESLISAQINRLPNKTLSMVDWQNKLAAHVNSGHLNNEIEYWSTLPWNKISPLKFDYVDNFNKNYLGSFKKIKISLSKKETSALTHVLSGKLKISMIDLLIALVVKVFATFNSDEFHLIKVVDSGRDLELDVDLTRTVGWIAISRILLLKVAINSNIFANVKVIADQIKKIPNRGLGFELLQYYHEDKNLREKMNAFSKPEILLNYHGVVQKNGESDFLSQYYSNETLLPLFDTRNSTHEKFICNASINNGRLIMEWQYNFNFYSKDTISLLMNMILDDLKMLSVSEQLEAMSG